MHLLLLVLIWLLNRRLPTSPEHDLFVRFPLLCVFSLGSIHNLSLTSLLGDPPDEVSHIDLRENLVLACDCGADDSQVLRRQLPLKCFLNLDRTSFDLGR